MSKTISSNFLPVAKLSQALLKKLNINASAFSKISLEDIEGAKPHFCMTSLAKVYGPHVDALNFNTISLDEVQDAHNNLCLAKNVGDKLKALEDWKNCHSGFTGL